MNGNLSYRSNPYFYDISSAFPQKIINNIYLGDADCALNKCWLDAKDIKYIIDVGMNNNTQFVLDGINYLCLSILDLESENIVKYFDICHQFIELSVINNESILIHCGAGISRSSTIVISYLMKKYYLDARLAYYMVRNKRPCIKPNNGFMAQLKEYENELKKLIK